MIVITLTKTIITVSVWIPNNLNPSHSFQHNFIKRIHNLEMTSRLVFLDLYHNRWKTFWTYRSRSGEVMNYFRLDHIAGLEPLVNLRVLMLGKNRIRKVRELKHFNDIKMITTTITTIAIMTITRSRDSTIVQSCLSWTSTAIGEAKSRFHATNIYITCNKYIEKFQDHVLQISWQISRLRATNIKITCYKYLDKVLEKVCANCFLQHSTYIAAATPNSLGV